MEQLKRICKQRNEQCIVSSTLSIDEPNQSKQHRHKNLSWGLYSQDSHTLMVMYVLLVHYNDDQRKIRLISFMKKV